MDNFFQKAKEKINNLLSEIRHANIKADYHKSYGRYSDGFHLGNKTSGGLNFMTWCTNGDFRKAFGSQNELNAFIEQQDLNAAFYSLETPEDVEARTRLNLLQAKMQHKEDAEMDDLFAPRHLEHQNGNLQYVIGNKKYPMLDTEQAKKQILERLLADSEKQGGIDLKYRLWSNDIVSKITPLLFNEGISQEGQNAEHQRALIKYQASSYKLVNNLLSGRLNNIDMQALSENEIKKNEMLGLSKADLWDEMLDGIDVIYLLDDLMKQAEHDMIVYRNLPQENAENTMSDKSMKIPQYISTTSGCGIGWFDNGKNASIKMHIKKGTPIIWDTTTANNREIQSLKADISKKENIDNSDENEVILPPMSFALDRRSTEIQGGRKVESYEVSNPQRIDTNACLLTSLMEMRQFNSNNTFSVEQIDGLISQAKRHIKQRNDGQSPQKYIELLNKYKQVDTTKDEDPERNKSNKKGEANIRSTSPQVVNLVYLYPNTKSIRNMLRLLCV